MLIFQIRILVVVVVKFRLVEFSLVDLPDSCSCCCCQVLLMLIFQICVLVVVKFSLVVVVVVDLPRCSARE